MLLGAVLMKIINWLFRMAMPGRQELIMRHIHVGLNTCV